MKVVRYKTNPFLEDFAIKKKDKMVKVSVLGKENNVLVNNDTGEVVGTHTIAIKKVDSEQFIKLFTQNIAWAFDLSSAGIKAFTVVAWIVQNEALNKDTIVISAYSIEEFNARNQKNISLQTFYRGLRELEKNKIIAKHQAQALYFINPNFIFNGDRVAFTTIIEREKEPTLFDEENNAIAVD